MEKVESRNLQRQAEGLPFAEVEVRGDPRGAKGMAADRNLGAEIGRAALDHAPRIDAVHRLFG